MYQISPRDFSKLNSEINHEIEKILLKFITDGKIKIVPNGEKKRGRPRKVQTKIEQKEKRPRGRPRKTVAAKSVDGPKRGRGRPKKVVII